MNIYTKTIPIFPLSGVLLLPSGNLPLNIFEPRYIAMVNYALKHNKLIEQKQKINKKNNPVILLRIKILNFFILLNRSQFNTIIFLPFL